jgi:uncharacterized protein (UPF0332 family)
MQVDKSTLIQYRIKRAGETLDEAKLVAKNERLLLAANRIYYSAFYAVSALAIKNDFITTKHGQLLGWFNQNFVKSKLVEKHLGEFYRNAFQMRQRSDYDDFVEFDKESIDDKLKLASEFIDKISNLL